MSSVFSSDVRECISFSSRGYTLKYEPEVHFEITEHGEEKILAKGGRGGLGNSHFKSATIRRGGSCVIFIYTRRISVPFTEPLFETSARGQFKGLATIHSSLMT